MLTGLKKDTHLGRMLGVWLGRILEEDQADKSNTETVEMAHELWEKNKGDGREFINVADPKNTDPVVRDAWGTMGWRVKSEAETMFGKDTFWVRKDMVNDLIGYRAAGVSDAWTGITRWSPEMQRGFKEVGMVLFGTKAYRYMSTAEGAIEDVMSAVKTTIIVRSIVVMRDNLTANLLQLHMNGMSLPVTLPPSSIRGPMSGPLRCSQMTRMMHVRDLEQRVPELTPPHRSGGRAPDHPPRPNCALTPPMKVASSCADRAAMKAAASVPAV
jgi:hypothetical protein